MNVTLITRFFDTRNQGLGSYASLVYDSLKLKNVNINKISQDDSLLPTTMNLSYFTYYSMDLKRLLRKRDFKNTDVFHCLNPLESFYIPKNKSVTTVHDLIPITTPPQSFEGELFKKIFKKSIYSSIESEKIIVINPDLKDTLITEYGAEGSSIEILPPPIDGKYEPLNKKNDTYTIGTISGLYDRKRVDILIKSFLKADIENSKLMIGGKGIELEKLKKIANGDERIEFLGFVSDDEMNNFYNNLDVFVFPTEIEGYGMPIVEAMACGKPVITLNDAYIPSNLKNRTMICSEEELPGILQDRNFSCNIKDNIKFSKTHSIENIGEKLIKIYDTI